MVMPECLNSLVQIGDTIMLNLLIGQPQDMVWRPGPFFDFEFENSWLDDPLVREMVLDVDKSEIELGRYIMSPVLGPISPRELSGGVKGLIMMKFQPEHLYSATAFGDNCTKWILKLAEHQDIKLACSHIMEFPEPFEIMIVNDGRIVHTMQQLIDAIFDFDDDRWDEEQ